MRVAFAFVAVLGLMGEERGRGWVVVGGWYRVVGGYGGGGKSREKVGGEAEERERERKGRKGRSVRVNLLQAAKLRFF